MRFDETTRIVRNLRHVDVAKNRPERRDAVCEPEEIRNGFDVSSTSWHKNCLRNVEFHSGEESFELGDPSLPDYEPLLAAYHAAFASELASMVRELPIDQSSVVLDIASGDGAYTPWLVERVGRSGQVVSLDISVEYLELARRLRSSRESAAPEGYVAGSIDRLPFAPGSFDAVWCAQSLFSLPEPVKAVTRMAQVVKSGGLVAILENDSLHQVLLPWPIEVELAVRTEEWRILEERSKHPDKFYVGRRLVRVFREAGLESIQLRSHATSRVEPLDQAVRDFLSLYLEELRSKVATRLTGSVSRVFERLVDPQSKQFMLDQRDFHCTIIDHVVWGKVPSVSAR